MGKGRLTYDRRLFAGLVIYSLLLMACYAVFQYIREKEFKAEELNIKLQAINSRILDSLIDGDTVSARDLPTPADLRDLRVSVIDSSGRVVYDNSLDKLPGSNHRDRREIAQALTHGEGYTLRRHSESTGETYFYSAMHRDRYVVRTAVPYSVNLHQLLAADYRFLWVIGGITLAMCFCGFFVTRRLGQNVRRLSHFAEKAERGERILGTEPFPHDELGKISTHIVRLYAKLQQAVSDRDREHRSALNAEQEKNRIKRELTNNINHELKTPVAAINVCLETLLNRRDMPAEKRDEFLRRCFNANLRLSRLLTDVSAITRLEDGGSSIMREQIDLKAIAAETVDEYLVEAAGKGVAIVNRIAAQGCIEGNTELMGSVFRNLLSNAIAYSGGTMIELDSRVTDAGETIVTVADNGTGVGAEHLPHLFERFYRIDKGRSRLHGGTGLGLAIVKNAITWHGGSVAIDNRPNGGLIVTIALPAIQV